MSGILYLKLGRLGFQLPFCWSQKWKSGFSSLVSSFLKLFLFLAKFYVLQKKKLQFKM